MNLSALLNELSYGILRDSAEPRLWSDSMLTDYLNTAVREFVFATDSGRSIKEFTLQAGDTTIRVTPPYYCVYLVQVGSIRLRRASAPIINSGVGTPTEFFVRDESTIVFNAAPDSALVITIDGLEEPRPMVSSVDEPDKIDEKWHYALLHYAAWRALSHSDVEGYDPTLAEKHYAQWVNAINRAKTYNWKRKKGGPLFAQSQVRFN